MKMLLQLMLQFTNSFLQLLNNVLDKNIVNLDILDVAKDYDEIGQPHLFVV